MRATVIFAVLLFVLTGCAGSTMWTRQDAVGQGGEALKSDTQVCKRSARREVPEANYPAGPSYGRYGKSYAGHYTRQRKRVFEACMMEKGWEKVEVEKTS